VPPMVTARRVPYDLFFNVDRRMNDYPEVLHYEMRESETEWTQKKTTFDVHAFDSARDRLQFKIPPIGTFSLYFMHAGSAALAVFKGVPYQLLTLSGSPSQSAETDEGTSGYDPLVDEQTEAYWASI